MGREKYVLVLIGERSGGCGHQSKIAKSLTQIHIYSPARLRLLYSADLLFCFSFGTNGLTKAITTTDSDTIPAMSAKDDVDEDGIGETDGEGVGGVSTGSVLMTT